MMRAIKVSCYSIEVTFGKPPGKLRLGAGCQGNQPQDWRVGAFTSTPVSGEGRGVSD